MKKSLKIDVKPSTGVLQDISGETGDFLKPIGFPDKTVVAQTAILKELIKNATKYGKSTSGQSSMTIRVDINADSITVELSNAIDDAALPSLQQLDKTIQFIRGHQDPFEPYLTGITHLCHNLKDAETDTLSLLLTAYQTNAIFDFFVSEDKKLNLSAVRSFQEDWSN